MQSSAVVVRWIDDKEPATFYVCPTSPTSLTVNKLPSWDAYVASGYGRHRMGGLDIRGAGRYLFRDYDELSEDDVRSVAGVPWHELRKVPAVKDIADDAADRTQAMDARAVTNT